MFLSTFPDVPGPVSHSLALPRVLQFLVSLHGLIKGNLQEHVLHIFIAVYKKKPQIELKSQACNGVPGGLRESHQKPVIQKMLSNSL